MKSLWYYWMHWRPTFWEDMTPQEDEVLGPHGDYVGRLHDAGRIVVAGGIMEPPGGIVCFYAEDRHEAQTTMEADPLFAAQIVEITLHELRAGFVGGIRYAFTDTGEGQAPDSN
ncbi:MAG TPA: YciI family protein [Candidatus Eisenbacteria bacterium]|nr:YciI family protein [Candidatus Eisenbacteria bacterium]